MVDYTTDVARVTEADVEPLFEGWAQRPTAEMRVRILQAAHTTVLAYDGDTLVGFVTAISDGVSWAYVPLLEVVAAYRARGIATELMSRVLDRYAHLYGIDLVCDDDLVPFYERLGMRAVRGMVIRNPAAFAAKNGTI